ATDPNELVVRERWKHVGFLHAQNVALAVQMPGVSVLVSHLTTRRHDLTCGSRRRLGGGSILPRAVPAASGPAPGPARPVRSSCRAEEAMMGLLGARGRIR